MAIVVADVVAEYGAYYKNGGQSVASLFKKLYRSGVTEKYFRRIPTSNTRLEFGNSSNDRVLQPFQQAFTPIGTVTFKPHPVELYHFKFDRREYPDAIANNWLGFLEGEGIIRKDWPFVRWLMEEHLFPQLEQEYEDSEAFKGIYVAPTPGTAGALGTASNGIKKKFDDHSAELNTILTGAAPSDKADYCTYVEEFVEEMDEEYRDKVDFLFLSRTNALKYRQGKRLKYNINYSQAPELSTIEDFSNIQVAGLPSMAGSETLWTTLASNRIQPLKKSEKAAPEVGSFSERSVSIMLDWWKSLDFLFYGAIWRNDQD